MVGLGLGGVYVLDGSEDGARGGRRAHGARGAKEAPAHRGGLRAGMSKGAPRFESISISLMKVSQCYLAP